MRPLYGMVPDFIIITIASILEIFIILWGISQLNREIRENVEDLEESIDKKLALAIQSTGLVASGEPINPVQAAIAGLIQNMASNQQKPREIELSRDDKGLFAKKD